MCDACLWAAQSRTFSVRRPLPFRFRARHSCSSSDNVAKSFPSVGRFNVKIGCHPDSVSGRRSPFGVKVSRQITTTPTAFPWSFMIGEPDIPGAVGPVPSDVPRRPAITRSGVGIQRSPSSASSHPFPAAACSIFNAGEFSIRLSHASGSCSET